MLLISANKALRTEKPKENIYGEIKITKKNKEKDNKRIKELENKINNVYNGGWRGKIYNEKIKPFKDEINKIKNNNDLSKEY